VESNADHKSVANEHITSFSGTLYHQDQNHHGLGPMKFTSINFSQWWMASNAVEPSGSTISRDVPCGLSYNLFVRYDESML
jgi:hypothetical protein